MTRFLGASLVVMGTLSVGSMAHAQTEIREPDKVVFERITKLEFGDVELVGELQSPGDSYVFVAPRASFASMIPVRTNFLRELGESTDNL